MNLTICRKCKSSLSLQEAKEALDGYFLCPTCHKDFLAQYETSICPNCRYSVEHFGLLPSVCLECGAVRD